MIRVTDDHSDERAAVDDPATAVERLTAGLDAADVAVDPEEAPSTFDAPWQARAFGLAVALHDADERDWSAFQERFVDRIGDADPTAMQADVEETYYERWLDSLEALLLEEGVLDEAEIERRAAEFTAGERDAAEFVVDDPGVTDGDENHPDGDGDVHADGD